MSPESPADDQSTAASAEPEINTTGGEAAPTPAEDGDAGTGALRDGHASVESVVRHSLATAMGGRRGMIEGAVPTLIFTVTWLATREMRWALGVSLGVAIVLLAMRVVQRSSVQYVVNAIFGIGLGWLFVSMAARRGGSADDQALAYFLPGILYNAGYAVLLGLTVIVGWPIVGFMVGSVTGDPTGWHSDRQIVKLCNRLTLLLVAPCVLRVVLQAPLWLAGTTGAMSADGAIAALGLLKVLLGWPLQIAALTSMVWLLSRNHTPLEPTAS